MVGMWLKLEGCNKATASTGEQCCLHSGGTDAQTIQRTTQQLLNRWNDLSNFKLERFFKLDLSNDLCGSCVVQSRAHFDEITVVRSVETSAEVSMEAGGAASTTSSATLYPFNQEEIRKELEGLGARHEQAEGRVKNRLKKQLQDAPEQNNEQPD
jgi:hypothetical protein